MPVIREYESLVVEFENGRLYLYPKDWKDPCHSRPSWIAEKLEIPEEWKSKGKFDDSCIDRWTRESLRKLINTRKKAIERIRKDLQRTIDDEENYQKWMKEI